MRQAFTLAEVLITLGIIGVVAAMTIPSLITKHHRRVAETKLAKFYSIMNQAIRMSFAENGDTSYDPNAEDKGVELKNWLDKNIFPYLKSDYFGDVIISDAGTQYYKVTLTDGSGFVSYMFQNGDVVYFFYCLNAGDKSCIKESYDGKNTFLFQYTLENQIFEPYNSSYYDSVENAKKSCYKTTDEKRHTCATLIFKNGWKIPNDYPWIR